MAEKSFSLVLSALSLALFSITPAQAEDGAAPPSTQGDSDVTLVNPKFEFKRGHIETSPLRLNIDAGYVQGSDGSQGGTFRARGAHSIYVWGSNDLDTAYYGETTHRFTAGTFRFDAGGAVELDVTSAPDAEESEGDSAEVPSEDSDQARVSRLGIESPTLAFVAVQNQSYDGDLEDEGTDGETPFATESFALVEGRYQY